MKECSSDKFSSRQWLLWCLLPLVLSLNACVIDSLGVPSDGPVFPFAGKKTAMPPVHAVAPSPVVSPSAEGISDVRVAETSSATVSAKVADSMVLSPKHEYLIAPGDTVNVMVWRNPEVSMSVPVRPDGKITTPLVEDMPASGKTSTQLARDIEQALAKYIRDPIVTVVVSGMAGNFDEQIRVIGQAAKPQALPYRENMTVLDVLIAVGGMTEFAAGNRATLIRKSGARQQQVNVRLNDLINRGDISANIPVRPGDILVIPESLF